MPALERIVLTLPRSGYVADTFLRLVETSPRAAMLPFVARAAQAWSEAIGIDTDFWLDKEMGTRCCAWLDQTLGTAEPTAADRASLLAALDVMVRSGVTQAKDLEAQLAGDAAA
jgi:hypothetical protein